MDILVKKTAYEFFEKQTDKLLHYLHLGDQTLKTFEWVNKDKESFLPFDFFVETNSGTKIRLDVKSTNSKDFFIISENEFIQTKKWLDKSKNNHYLILFLKDLKFNLHSKNLELESTPKFRFFKFNKLESIWESIDFYEKEFELDSDKINLEEITKKIKKINISHFN